MFPKAEEAKNYKCGRTKTTAIVHALADYEKQDTLSKLRQCSVSVQMGEMVRRISYFLS